MSENISLAIFYELTKFNCLVAFTSWDIGQYVYCNCLLTRLWCHNFEINLVFLIKPFFLHDQKFKANNCHILRTEGFKMKWKAFFTIFKGPLLKQIKNLEDESPSLNSHKKSYLKYLQVKVVKKLNGSWKLYRPLKSFSFCFPWQKSVEFAVQKILRNFFSVQKV